jgi:hypothetical protein
MAQSSQNKTLFQLFMNWLESKLESLAELSFFEINMAFNGEFIYLSNGDRRRLGQLISKKVDNGELPLVKCGKSVTNHMQYRIV